MRTGRFNLARIVEARGDTAGAERLYREELATYADNGKARFNLAQLLRERGDRQGYLHELLESIEKAPEFGPAFFFLAREELRNGGLAGAEELARRGLEVDPRSEIAPLGHFVLADVYGRQGDAARARAEALKGAAARGPHPVAAEAGGLGCRRRQLPAPSSGPARSQDRRCRR